MSDSGAALRWPPPGLERMQGDLWRVVTRSALALAFLVFPVLYLSTGSSVLASLGPLGDTWFVTVALGAVGLAFFLDAYARVARILSRAQEAVERGYRAATVLQVVADARRDTGFLLSGARHYATLEPRERVVLSILRALTPLLHAAGGLWACTALALGIWGAGRGWVTPAGLWALTVVPAGALYAFGAVTGITEDVRVRRARRAWHRRSWSDDLDPDTIREWRRSAEDSWGAGASPIAHPEMSPRFLGRARRGAAVVAVLSALSILVLLPVSAVGPVLGRMLAPPSHTIQSRAAELEGYRPQKLVPDAGVSPGEAGRLLQSLAYVGSDRAAPPGEIAPPVRTDRPWLPDAGRSHATAAPPVSWPEALFEEVTGSASGPPAEVRNYLAEVASHPVLADFRRLARAEEIDVAIGRWTEPQPPGTTLATLPAPQLGGLRAAAHAQLAAAALAVVDDRVGDAEIRVREVLSVGFLLADQGLTLVDHFMGQSLIRMAGTALESLYRVSGRTEAYEALRLSRQVSAGAAARATGDRPAGAEALVRALPGLVLDPSTVRGVAWESFALLATLGPCLNLNRVVFGPGEAYTDFVEEARQALVRWPSEEPLFQIASRGFLRGESGWGAWLGGALALLLSTEEGSCGHLLRTSRAR